MFTLKPAAGGQASTSSFADYLFEVGGLYNPGTPSTAGTTARIKLPPGRALVVFHLWNTDGANAITAQVLATNDSALAEANWVVEAGSITIAAGGVGVASKLVDCGYDTLALQIKDAVGNSHGTAFCTVRVTSITE